MDTDLAFRNTSIDVRWLAEEKRSDIEAAESSLLSSDGHNSTAELHCIARALHLDLAVLQQLRIDGRIEWTDIFPGFTVIQTD